ncbi:MAG: hypothetical protein JHC61_08420 [Burkholderiaceae bacterium]|nr:hypothetical protein [Burkholderiaceae bacterium]
MTERGALKFYTDIDLGRGLRTLFLELQTRLGLSGAPIKAYIAGGIAVHLYTAYRVSMDVDAEFGARLHLPRDLGVEVTGPDGRPLWLHFDVHVLSPVDLAVSKISRFADHDRHDIAALVLHGLATAEAIEARAHDALIGFVGNVGSLKMNIADAVAIACKAEEKLAR